MNITKKQVKSLLNILKTFKMIESDTPEGFSATITAAIKKTLIQKESESNDLVIIRANRNSTSIDDCFELRYKSKPNYHELLGITEVLTGSGTASLKMLKASNGFIGTMIKSVLPKLPTMEEINTSISAIFKDIEGTIFLDSGHDVCINFQGKSISFKNFFTNFIENLGDEEI